MNSGCKKNSRCLTTERQLTKPIFFPIFFNKVKKPHEARVHKSRRMNILKKISTSDCCKDDLQKFVERTKPNIDSFTFKKRQMFFSVHDSVSHTKQNEHNHLDLIQEMLHVSYRAKDARMWSWKKAESVRTWWE